MTENCLVGGANVGCADFKVGCDPFNSGIGGIGGGSNSGSVVSLASGTGSSITANSQYALSQPQTNTVNGAAGGGSEVVCFDLGGRKYLPVFRRILPALEATFRTVTLDLCTSSCSMKVSSSDWNAFTTVQQLLTNIIQVTVKSEVCSEYEEAINAELGKVKVPKKHLLGKLRDVFIDCNNVATAHGHGKFSWRGVMIACDHFESLGHNVIMIVPTYRKKQVASPDEKEFVDMREKYGQLKCVASSQPSHYQPDRRTLPPDDGFLLQCCAELDGVLLSNDRFTDFNDDARLRSVTRDRVIPFLFIKDTLIIGGDSYSRKKVDCERLLLKSSPYLEECERMGSKPCPYGEKCNYGKKCKYMHEVPPESRTQRKGRLCRELGPKQRYLERNAFDRSFNVNFANARAHSRDNATNPFPSSRLQAGYPKTPVHATDSAPSGNVFFTPTYWKQDPSPVQQEVPIRNVERSPNTDGALLSYFKARKQQQHQLQGRPALKASGDASNLDRGQSQFEIDFHGPPPVGFSDNNLENSRPGTYNMWTAHAFELSPSKKRMPNTECPPNSWSAVAKTPATNSFSYFSDSGSSCEDFAVVGNSVGDHSPVFGFGKNEQNSIASDFGNAAGVLDLEERDDSPVPNNSVFSSEIPKIWNQSSYSKEESGSPKMHIDSSYSFDHGNNPCMSQSSVTRKNRVENFEDKDATKLANRAGTKNTTNMTTNNPQRSSTVSARMEDYQSVMQILLDKSKQAYVLAVMKSHPGFTREEILVHIWNLGKSGSNSSELECCSEFVSEARKFIPDCYRLVGDENDSKLARAFFAVQQQPRDSSLSGHYLWQEVIKRIAFESEP